MKLKLCGWFVAFLLVTTCAFATEPFAAGQTWTYQSRPSESASRVLVLRVDDYPKTGRIVHVAILDLSFKRTPKSAAEPWTIAHGPFSEASLRRSVGKRDGSSAAIPAGFPESYAKWKAEAEKGKVQHWSMKVSDVVLQIEKWAREGRK